MAWSLSGQLSSATSVVLRTRTSKQATAPILSVASKDSLGSALRGGKQAGRYGSNSSSTSGINEEAGGGGGGSSSSSSCPTRGDAMAAAREQQHASSSSSSRAPRLGSHERLPLGVEA